MAAVGFGHQRAPASAPSSMLFELLDRPGIGENRLLQTDDLDFRSSEVMALSDDFHFIASPCR